MFSSIRSRVFLAIFIVSLVAGLAKATYVAYDRYQEVQRCLQEKLYGCNINL